MNKPKPTTNLAVTPQGALAQTAILEELRALIEGARHRVAVSVNRELVLLYWGLGQRIRVEILGETRAEYGEQILPTLSAKLTEEFGNGYSARNLARMIKFAEQFPQRSVVETFSETISWSHFVEILTLSQPIERDFYATMCHASRWSVRGLRREIAGALFTRTALSRNRDEVIKRELANLRDEDKWTPDLVFRDPYILPFLGLAMLIANAIWRRLWCAKWNEFYWSWAKASRSWRARNA